MEEGMIVNTPDFWEHMHDVFLNNNDLRDNPQEYPVIADMVEGSILELGCAFGQFSKYVPDHRYVGVDISQKLLARARHDFPERYFVKSDIRVLPFEDAEFDTTVILQTLEHFEASQFYLVLDEIQRVTRGKVIISLPRENMIPDQSHVLYFDESITRDVFPGAVFREGKDHHLLFAVDLTQPGPFYVPGKTRAL